MTGQQKEDVGYRRPPKASRWKKGQTGNPKRKRARKPQRAWRIIEEILATKVMVIEKGETRRVTAFHGILHQLFVKASAGNRPAARALAKYRAFAKAKPDTYVIKQKDFDDNPGNAFAEALKGADE